MPKPSCDAERRFFAKVHIDQEGGCWEWRAGKNTRGYGVFLSERGSRKYEKAHRVSWRIREGGQSLMGCLSAMPVTIRAA